MPNSSHHPRGHALRSVALALLAAGAALGASAPAVAQTAAPGTAAPQTATPPIAVGAVAPDFALRAATRWGLLERPVRPSDFRGQTLVIAFFYQARTKG
jgi:hypothetical protein